MKGIVCANFGERRCPMIPICYGAWHAKCYVQREEDRFPVLLAKDLDDSILDEGDQGDDDPDRFRTAREGDHMMCPFQCDTYHFVNIHKVLPDWMNNIKDKLCLLAIRMAILDSLWARETATVEANSREAKRYVFEASLMGNVRPYPHRGPFPIEDEWGMGPATVLLMRSLNKGKNSEFVQFETIRKVRSHFSNFVHTIPGGIGDMLITSDNVVSGISHSATNTPWFKRFMKGCHSRMGDV
jgi:hypothetical protein